MVLQTWGDVILSSLQQVWASVAAFLPLFFGAIIIFLIGLVIAVALGRVVEELMRALKVDSLLRELELEKALDRAGWKMNSGAFIGGLVRWFIIVVFLLAATNVIGLTQVSDFLRDVLLYLPNVIVAALILVIAMIVADVAERVTRGAVGAAGYKGALVGTVVRWAIWVFAIMAALLQLGIASTLVQTVLTGLVAALAIAFGLAFGLGGKDTAEGILDKLRGELKR